MFYKLKIKDWLYLAVLIVLTYLWINYDQLFLHEANQRMIAFPLFGMILLVIIFILIKPDKWFKLANTLIIILIPLFIALSLLFHVVINHDFQIKSVILWIITVLIIYLSGIIYKLLFEKR